MRVKSSSLLTDGCTNQRGAGQIDKWFYKLISEGKFPKPIKLGRSSRWKESKLKEWLFERIEQSRL
ncbi:helix-turn-helix transcriptional regulator [Pectobacterium brasiliense]|uniref:helix-turn-helix transcriptional regulator n=1 Tax=Pectobacterium brasiliense TaxID=180957 RepID=UPI0039F664B3